MKCIFLHKIIEKLEKQLKDIDIKMTRNFKGPETNKFKRISEEADAAMKRFSAKLRKELHQNGKSKQGKGEPV